MHLTNSILSLTVALAVTTGALAAPPASAQKRGMEIPLVRNQARRLQMTNGKVNTTDLSLELKRLKHKYAKSLTSYAKNTGKKHKHDALHRVKQRGTGDVDLEAQLGGALWTGQMSFGEPPQSMYMDFDTGSSDTLANSDAYKPDDSKASKDTGTPFKLSYADGTSAKGDVYSDKLTIGDLKADKAYIGASKTQFIEGDGNSQGISGLAFPSLSSFEQKEPFFFSLIKAGAVDKKAFTMKLRKDGGSSLTLGAADDGAEYVDLSEDSYWSVDAKVNDQDISGIVDSGTTLIVGPTDEAGQLFDSLGLEKAKGQDGSARAKFDCSKPPKVSFTFGSKKVELTEEAISHGKDDDGSCVFSVVGEDVGSNGWIIGDPLFLSSESISFDVEGKRVGFS